MKPMSDCLAITPVTFNIQSITSSLWMRIGLGGRVAKLHALSRTGCNGQFILSCCNLRPVQRNRCGSRPSKRSCLHISWNKRFGCQSRSVDYLLITKNKPKNKKKNKFLGSSSNVEAFYNRYGSRISKKIDIAAQHCMVQSILIL